MKLLESVRARIRTRHFSRATEVAYLGWIRRFIDFTGRRHPSDLGKREVGAFLTSLAVRRRVAASTQNQALTALQLLYADVLEQPLALGSGVVRAKRPHRVPVVLSRADVAAVINHTNGLSRLIVQILYGSGLRIGECLALRVKDVDIAERVITVKDGKGAKDRLTVLPETVIAPLMIQLGNVRELHARDHASNKVVVPLPGALARKYPSAPRELHDCQQLRRSSKRTLQQSGDHR